MNESNTFKVAVVQHAPVFLNLEASLEKARHLIEQAAEAGASVIAFPETWLPGYPVWLDDAPNAALWDHQPAKSLFQLLVDNAVEVPSQHVQTLQSIAKKTETYVVMGIHERLGGTLYNTMLFLHRNGNDYEIHRKLVPTYTERMVWGRGDGGTLRAMNTEYGPIGGLVCWEHWMPMARAAMHAQREVLHIAQWPMVKELHQLCSRHYAFEGQCFVIAAGAAMRKGEMLEGFRSLSQTDHPAQELLESIPGRAEDRVQRGGSAIIAPNTDYVAGPFYEEAGIFCVDLDLNLIAQGHLTLDTDGHYSRPDVFQLNVNDQPQANVNFISERRKIN